MNKKTLTLAVVMALAAGSVFATVPQNQNQDMYPASVMELTKKAVATNLENNLAVTKDVSLNLSESVKMAIDNNYNVKATEDNLESAKAKLGMAKSARYPKISYGYKFSRSGNKVELANGVSVSGENSPSNASGHSLSISMPIYTGGAIDGNVRAANYASDIAYAKVLQAKSEAKLVAAKAYFNVLRSNNMLTIANQAVSDLNKHLKNVNLQYQVGVVAKSDVLSTEVAVANAKTSRIQADNAVSLASASLNHALSLPSNTAIHIMDKEFSHTIYGLTMQEATAYALTHRPEVIQSVLGVEIMDAQLEAARAGFKPKVQVGASKSWAHQSLPEPTTPLSPTGSGENWNAFIGVSWDLWDGGSTAKNVKAAREAYEAQKYQSSNAISAITLEVKQAYLNLKEAESTIASTKAAVDKAEESFRIASLRYTAGVGINLDVLDAELNLNKARNAYVDALYNYNVNVATLEKAMGTPVELPIGAGLAQVHYNTTVVNIAPVVVK